MSEGGRGPEPNLVLVGKKPLSVYLARCFDIINASGDESVTLTIEGMGQNIVKVVDLVNFLRRFLTKKDVKISDFSVELVPKKEVHGLPKHVSRLRLVVEVSSKV